MARRSSEQRTTEKGNAEALTFGRTMITKESGRDGLVANQPALPTATASLVSQNVGGS